MILDAPKMEDGKTRGRGLLTYPEKSNNGLITGKYPGVNIKTGDHFQALINCEYKANDCDMIFKLEYQIGSGAVKSLGQWREVYEGKYYPINIDLSSLNGEKVKFILSVLANGSSHEDFALWIDPRITRQSGQAPTATSTITSTPTMTGTPTATFTATPTSTSTADCNFYQHTYRNTDRNANRDANPIKWHDPRVTRCILRCSIIILKCILNYVFPKINQPSPYGGTHMFVRKISRQIFLTFLAVALLLTACNVGAAPSPTLDINAINTAMVGTTVAQLSSQFTQTALAAPTSTPLPQIHLQ